MRILVLTDRFAPEVSAASTRLLAHAKAWSEAGHEVTVATCVPNFPRGVPFPGYKNRWRQEEMIEGVRVLRLWSFMAPNQGLLRRSFDYFSYVFSVTAQARALKPHADVILASSPPITVAFAGSILAWLLRRPWVFEVRDLWPASIRAVGVPGSPLLRLLEWLELKLYGDAARVIVLTDPFRQDLLGRGVPDAKISVVTNGVHAEGWCAPFTAQEARARLGLPADAFIVGYVGTVGLAHGAAVLIRTAARLRDNPIHFVLLGEGADRPAVEKQARLLGLEKVTFHNFVPFTKMPQVLAALDVGTVLLKNDPVFDTVIPSKLLELMAAGLPIAAAAGAETRRIISEAGSGICVPPEDDAALADAILALQVSTDQGRSAGENGRTYVREHYDRRVLARRALTLLEQAVESQAH